jgi:hypothetical protein
MNGPAEPATRSAPQSPFDANVPSIRAETAHTQISPRLSGDNTCMQLGHHNILYTDMKESLRRVGMPTGLILGKEIDTIGICLVRAVACAQGEITCKDLASHLR